MSWTRFGLSFLAVCLALVVVPEVAPACGPDCQCGPGCQCAPAPPPPPLDPKANPVRRNQATLTGPERRAFVDAVKQLQRTYRPGAKMSVYDEYVRVHVDAMHCGMIHHGPVFFPWHRQYVRNFELELQALNPEVALPYWDFVVDRSGKSALWADDFMGGNGDRFDYFIVKSGPFRQGEWRPAYGGPDLYRNFGGFRRITLPTLADLAGGFLVPRYDARPYNENSDISRSFRNYMTGWNHPSGDAEMHNRVHEWVNGSMMTDASPNDPVFWLMHAFLDRTWAEWQELHGAQYPKFGAMPGHNLRDRMPSFGTTPASVLNHWALGYVYDTE